MDRLDRILDSRFSRLEFTIVGLLQPEKTLDGVMGKSGRANETAGDDFDILEGVPFLDDMIDQGQHLQRSVDSSRGLLSLFFVSLIFLFVCFLLFCDLKL